MASWKQSMASLKPLMTVTNPFSTTNSWCIMSPRDSRTDERFEDRKDASMSTIERGVSTAPASYVETAQQRLEELHRWRDQIPRFVIPPTADATQRLS